MNVIPSEQDKKPPSKHKLEAKMKEIEINAKYKADRKDTEMYAKFKKKEEQKIERELKIANPQNLMKAREKVKQYMQLSKQVLDEDTDEEYIDVIVKKKPKKPVVYKDINIIKEADIILEAKEQKEEAKPIVIEAKPIVKEEAKPKTTYRTSFTSSLSEIDSLRRNMLIKF